MKHFLIIGGGIAGSTAAYFLLQKNCRITVIDSGENHSTAVAAGQVNPIVFRRMTKSWRVDDLLPFAKEFYGNLEEFAGLEIMVNKPIRRMFAHEQERESWFKRMENLEFSEYLEKVTAEDDSYSGAINTFGSGRLKQSFYVRSDHFMTASQNYIQLHEFGKWITEKINFNDIDPKQKSWKEQRFDGILFCTGFENNSNPFFNFLQIDQTKGEVLTLKTDLANDESLNRRCFVLHLKEDLFRVGSTYEWNTPDVTPTEKARLEIERNFKTLVENNYLVLDHQAGIRPTTKDRRPVMGEHPEISGFYIFNGLGAKGYMTAPLLAKEIVEFILNAKPLHEEVDLRRYL